MNILNSRIHRFILVGIIAFLIGATASCEYKVPITQKPTRKIDARLVGEWVSTSGNLRLKIRFLNETTYIVSYSGVLFEAFHSDISGSSFLTAQELETPQKSYTYLTYTVSEDGSKLVLRLVNDKVIPRDVKSTSEVQELLRQNLQNPALLLKKDEFTRVK